MTEVAAEMVDTIHADVRLVPHNLPDVGGYVSGSSDIDWTSADWSQFPNSKHVRIYQGFGNVPPLNGWDVLDVETGALTPQEAADLIEQRVIDHITWSTIYGGDAALVETSRLTAAKGHNIWNGHVNAWVANWNLNQASAVNMLGTMVHGMTCIGVQWASPSSNPNTILPGTHLTLAQANCDLSVVIASWEPSGGWDFPVNPPKPPPVTTQTGILVILPTGAVTTVRSADGGHTWHA
jgi:hypothetical protein